MVAYKYNEECETEEAVVCSFKEEWKRRREIKRRNAIYYLKQKVSGLVLVVSSIVLPMVDKDITASVLLLPLGLFLLLTKEKVMDFKGK